MGVIVIGASGLLGKYLMREWETDEVLGFGSNDLDIRDRSRVQQVLGDSGPEWVVLAAAYTDVDGCELNPELARSINAQGAIHVAEAARRNGSRLMFISTDYVFDGTKTTPYEIDDLRNPQSVYGRSKAEAETAIQHLLPESCIVRTSWVFGIGGKCFPDTILKLATVRPELQVVNDQRGCPTYARDLARTIIQLCRRNAEGIVHVTNRGDCTWYEFAAEIVRMSGSKTNVLPTTTDQFPRPARRPVYSVLSDKKLREYQLQMPTWHEALGAYLAERKAQAQDAAPSAQGENSRV